MKCKPIIGPKIDGERWWVCEFCSYAWKDGHFAGCPTNPIQQQESTEKRQPIQP